jgi:hypothetical protein
MQNIMEPVRLVSASLPFIRFIIWCKKHEKSEYRLIHSGVLVQPTLGLQAIKNF